jgi:hypothetical protein
MSRHTITRDDLIAHIEAERWERYASAACAGKGAKSLDFSTQRQFRVTVGGTIIYIGQSPTDAVNAYNEEMASS